MKFDLYLDNFFSLKLSLFVVLFVSVLTLVLSNYVYLYEDELSLQDASEYIALARDPSNYLNLTHQGSLRIFPSLLVFFLKIIGISIEISFKYLTYFLFIFLNLKIFFLLKKFKIKNYIALSSLAILIYSNHSVIYSVFNYYQLLDLFSYIFILYFIELSKKTNLVLLFTISLLSVFTKEYLLVLVILVHLKNFLKTKDIKIIISMILILLIFLIHYNLAGSNNISEDNLNILSLSSSYFLLFNTFYSSMINGLIINKNIFLFLPFIILICSRSFLKFLLQNYQMIIFSLIPIGFSVFLYGHVGNNFFRVFNHGFFIIIFYSIIFLTNKISQTRISNILFFISPIFFLIDYFYIIFNISQSGFYNFFQFTRYEFFSGYYFFNLIFLILFLINFKKIFYGKE